MQASAWPALKEYLLRRYTVVFVDEVRWRLGAVSLLLFIRCCCQ